MGTRHQFRTAKQRRPICRCLKCQEVMMTRRKKRKLQRVKKKQQRQSARQRPRQRNLKGSARRCTTSRSWRGRRREPSTEKSTILRQHLNHLMRMRSLKKRRRRKGSEDHLKERATLQQRQKHWLRSK